MRFEERELKPYAEVVSATELREGSTYFSVTFVDDDMCTPVMQTLVFVEKINGGLLQFQDVESYRRGVRYDSATVDDHATFFQCSEEHLNNIFEYEHALDVLAGDRLERTTIICTRFQIPDIHARWPAPHPQQDAGLMIPL